MGEYLQKYNLVINDLYCYEIESAKKSLKDLLLSINKDMLEAKDVYEKVKTKKAILKLLPVLEELNKGLIGDKVINILRLDKNKFVEKEETEDIKKEVVEIKDYNNDDLFDELFDNLNKSSLDNYDTNIVEDNTKEDGTNSYNQIDKKPLSPKTLEDYVGQEQIKKTIKIAIEAAKKENRVLEHQLICSPYGLGKTTLANIIANEMNLPFFTVNSTNLKDPRSLSLFFSKIKENCIVFIDEIHALKPDVQTVLLSIMSDFKISLIDKDGNTEEYEIPPFTLIGATTQAGELLKPFLNRFSILELADYTEEEKRIITKAKFDKLGYNVTEEAVDAVAKRSRGIPRTIETFVKGIRDIAINLDTKNIDNNIVNEYFEMIQIDELGLGKVDFKVLKALYDSEYPLGLITLESKTNIQREDLEFRYEPYLLKIGFIEKTEKGRIITQKGIDYVISKLDDDSHSENEDS